MRTKIIVKFMSVAIGIYMSLLSASCFGAHFEGYKFAQGHLEMEEWDDYDPVFWFRNIHDKEWDGTRLFDEYVPVNGKTYPIVCESYFVLLPVRKLSASEKITPVIVNGTMRKGSASAKVYTDREVYEKFKDSKASYMKDTFSDRWPNGSVDDTLVWIWVTMGSGSEKIKAKCDVAKRPAAGIYSNMTMSEYAKQYNVDFQGVVDVSVSTWFEVGIKETGEVYPTRFYCHRLIFDISDRLEWHDIEVAIAENAGDENAGEAIVCSAAWYVSPESAGAVEFVVKSGDISKGEVSGGGVYKTAEKAKIKAVADKGYIFAGWYENPECTKPCALLGENYKSDSATYVIGDDNATLYAKFVEKSEIVEPTESFISAAETFNGYVVDGNGSVAGTIQIKAGKPNKKTGVSKLTASITMLGEKKVSIKGEAVDGSTTMTSKKDGRELSVNLAADAMTGSFDGKSIVFTRNIFTAKDDESKALAETVLQKVEGVYVAALLGENGVGSLSIDIKNKGKVKVSGTLPGGVKVSVNTQLMAKEDGSCEIPVVYSKKNALLSLVVKITTDGNVSVTGYDPAQFSEVKISRHSKETLDAMLSFSIDVADVAASFAGVADVNDSLLPDGVTLTQERGKWKAPKAGKVKYKNGVWDISGENHSGLKLSYKSKTGMFTGSFKVFGLVNGRLKKYSVKVSGVVVDGVGYGAATVKKPATSWSIILEPYEMPTLPDWVVGTFEGYCHEFGWYDMDRKENNRTIETGLEEGDALPGGHDYETIGKFSVTVRSDGEITCQFICATDMISFGGMLSECDEGYCLVANNVKLDRKTLNGNRDDNAVRIGGFTLVLKEGKHAGVSRGKIECTLEGDSRKSGDDAEDYSPFYWEAEAWQNLKEGVLLPVIAETKDYSRYYYDGWYDIEGTLTLRFLRGSYVVESEFMMDPNYTPDWQKLDMTKCTSELIVVDYDPGAGIYNALLPVSLRHYDDYPFDGECQDLDFLVPVNIADNGVVEILWDDADYAHDDWW